MPVRDTSQMTEEEQLRNPEKGAEEEGWIETFENMFNGGVKPEENGMAKQVISPGSLEKNAESGIASLINKLKMPKEKLLQLGEEIRLTGKANVVDDTGRLVRTIGESHPEGKALKQMARDALAESNSRAPTVYKGFVGQ
jgi:hypothetical protein